MLVTLGADGAVRSSDEGAAHVPALELGRVVDTTGAGDTFVGSLVAALAGYYALVHGRREIARRPSA